MKNIHPDILTHAKILWDWHHMNHTLEKSDIILVLGGGNTNVIEQGIKLFHQGWAPFLVISGGTSGTTKHLYEKTEADSFAKIARSAGVPADKIILEENAQNTYENFIFTENVLFRQKIPLKTATVVAQTFMERRAYKTAQFRWPHIRVLMSSYDIPFEKRLSSLDDPHQYIHYLTGNVQRIEKYTANGQMIPEEIPENIQKSYAFLTAQGYTGYLKK
ncbi:MAG: YdcF family protein [Lactobacillales bacterium]|jgi:uncharacterized SAM-binding protein YcdF (DUF218 family)|nr:YdcF family protein [Lactobacillales bacterium]